MSKIKNNYLKEIYVITPFKSKNSDLLKSTINSLFKCDKRYLRINHYIIYYKSANKIIDNIKIKINSSKFKGKYSCNFIETSVLGIYSAINIGLKEIPKDSYYIVLGAGDNILGINDFLKFPKNKIIIFPYLLSASKDRNPIKKIRNIYRGMPYCHNAISYLNDGSTYNNEFKISADYEHFLKYIKKNNLNKKDLKDSIQENIVIEFESKSGISSKLTTKKILENIIIIYRYFGFLIIFLYIWHTFKRIINLVWKRI